jgi:tRNA threonylcarbamoyladenosine modification (KEOPS) complex  Pcc1 subunit
VTTVPADWSATIHLKAGSAELESWVEQALRPEAAREVPRSTAEIRRESAGGLTIEIRARDAGAMRAALNTYLGWIHLAMASERAGRGLHGPATSKST